MKIVFTSCMDAICVPDQPIWGRVEHVEKPDVLMLLGDQIYMDFGLGHSKRSHLIEKVKTDAGLLEYAHEMYERYAAQWAVASFRSALKSILDRGGKIELCWDDHDFAWNNSNGLGQPGDPNDAVTPWQVKAVSLHLFRQFSRQVKNKKSPDQYPAFDFALTLYREADIQAMSGAYEIDPAQTSDVRFALLDERWNRYPRSQLATAGEYPLLGQTQWQKLAALLSNQSGLTVIAGGLPMKHKYFASHQAWGPGEKVNTAYKEYDLILAAVKSPALYLCGDIHKNEFAGYLHNTQGTKNEFLLHLCASPAAIRSEFIVKFEPAYGVVNIDSVKQEVAIQCEKLTDGAWKEDIAARRLKYSNAGWKDTQMPAVPIPTDKDLVQHSTSAWDELQKAANANHPAADDLAIICRRAREKAYRNLNPYDLTKITEIFSDDELQELENGATSGTAHPQILSLSLRGKSLERLHLGDTMHGAVKIAFENARKRCKKTVALYIHGFNNSFEETVDQAYSLRMLYPEIEPILLSWPSGWTAPSLNAPKEAKLARDNAQNLSASLIAALNAIRACKAEFETQNFRPKCILLARSFGSIATLDLFRGSAPKDVLQGIDGIVFSAPAIGLKEYTRLAQAANIATYVIVNQKDTALKIGTQFIQGKPLGASLPAPKDDVHSNMYYFDCTDFPGVGKLHNIINHAPCREVKLLHQALLAGDFAQAQASEGFQRLVSPHNIWTKS